MYKLENDIAIIITIQFLKPLSYSQITGGPLTSMHHVRSSVVFNIAVFGGYRVGSLSSDLVARERGLFIGCMMVTYTGQAVQQLHMLGRMQAR
jgi:hypothetical protein